MVDFDNDTEFCNNLLTDEDLEVKPSIFTNRVYPIGRLKFFTNSLLIFGVMFLISIVLGMMFGGFMVGASKSSAFSLREVLLFPVLLFSLYLSAMNTAKRIYDIGWGDTTKNAMWLSIAIHCLNFVPLLGSLSSLIFTILFLSIPGKRA